MALLKVLTLSEVQAELHVSRSTVYRLIKSHDLDVLYIRSSIRVTRASLDAFLTRELQLGKRVA